MNSIEIRLTAVEKAMNLCGAGASVDRLLAVADKITAYISFGPKPAESQPSDQPKQA